MFEGTGGFVQLLLSKMTASHDRQCFALQRGIGKTWQRRFQFFQPICVPAVQLQCVAAGGNYTVGYVQPTGYSVSGAGSTCPSPNATTLTPLQLKVVDPLGRQLAMWIKVRTP